MQIVKIGQQVTLRVTVAACERLLALHLIDIVGLPEKPQDLGYLASNPAALTKVAWEISDKRLSDTAFAELVDGDTLPVLWDAVTKAIVDFFHDPTKAVIAALVEAVEARKTQMAQDMISAILGVPNEDGEQFGSLRESSELMPDSSVFVNSTTWPEGDSEQSGVAVVA